MAKFVFDVAHAFAIVQCFPLTATQECWQGQAYLLTITSTDAKETDEIHQTVIVSLWSHQARHRADSGKGQWQTPEMKKYHAGRT